jgi:hypothetical protein
MAAFTAAGAVARVIEAQPGGVPFGTRLRRLAALDAGAGFVVLGSGSVPLASAANVEAFVRAASVAKRGPILANNSFSADNNAIPPDVDLKALPDVGSDNGLPRWFEEQGRTVKDLRRSWRLQVDLDSPLDAILTGVAGAEDASAERVRRAIAGIRDVTSDATKELVIAGRTSAGVLRWVERSTASRTRSLVEERGMKTARAGQRAARTSLGLLLDRDGPAALGTILAELGDAAVIDTRVLLAHRLGTDESGWPPAADRFASDLLDAEAIADPWLRTLTAAAAEAPIPILLGGHTLVGPGLRLLLGGRRRRRATTG